MEIRGPPTTALGERLDPEDVRVFQNDLFGGRGNSAPP
jgi:hypothetical protein